MPLKTDGFREKTSSFTLKTSIFLKKTDEVEQKTSVFNKSQSVLALKIVNSFENSDNYSLVLSAIASFIADFFLLCIFNCFF